VLCKWSSTILLYSRSWMGGKPHEYWGCMVAYLFTPPFLEKLTSFFFSLSNNHKRNKQERVCIYIYLSIYKYIYIYSV
jgi:hypothetical protein